MQKVMRLFAKWHIWLGWLIGVPLIIWTLTGLVMVSRPIEEVRGTHLRKDISEAPLPSDAAIASGDSTGSRPRRLRLLPRDLLLRLRRGLAASLLCSFDAHCWAKPRS